jgi:hypothetical protein
MARPVSYGQAFGGRLVVPIPVAASQSFRAEGGRFVHKNLIGNAVIQSSNVDNVLGWAETSGTWSSSATAGANIIAINISDDAVFEMPIVSAITESTCKGLIGKLTDLEVISDIQYVNCDASSTRTIQIIGYKYYGSAVGEQSLLVKKYPANASFTGAS